MGAGQHGRRAHHHVVHHTGQYAKRCALAQAHFTRGMAHTFQSSRHRMQSQSLTKAVFCSSSSVSGTDSGYSLTTQSTPGGCPFPLSLSMSLGLFTTSLHG